jgi:AcrR family transcriptional regulator
VPATPAALRTVDRASSRERTRSRLLAVGRRAFGRKGLAGTNLKEDILVPARVSVGSFYHQFRDKTDLFVAVLEEHGQTFRAMIHAAHVRGETIDAAEAARHSYDTVFRIAEQNDDLFRILARERESTDPRVRAYLRDSRRRWVDGLTEDYRRMGGGSFADEPLRVAAELISAMTEGAVLNYLDLPARERSAQRRATIDALVRFTLGGLVGLLGAPLATGGRTGRTKK